MFDLNEIPDHPPDHFVAAGDVETAPAVVDAGVLESKISDISVPPCVPNDHDEASAATVEKPGELPSFRSSVGLAPSGSSLSSSLTVETSQVLKHQKGIDTKSSSLVHDGDVIGTGDGAGPASNFLQLKQQQKQPQAQEILQETDLCIGPHGSAYQFMSGEASTSHKHPVSTDASTSCIHDTLLDNCEDDRETNALFSLQKNTEHQIMLGNGHGRGEGHLSSPHAEGSAICLSLGGSSVNVHALGCLDLTRCSSSSLGVKKMDEFGLALGRGCDDLPPPASRKISDDPPFWCGKLRTDAPFLTPVDAYCLGTMKPDSRLKELPDILSLQKFVKLDEFKRSIRDGVTEPLIQLKPSLEASIEEVDRFNLMVEALSHGSGLPKSSSIVGLDFGKKKLSADDTFLYSAALISWEDAHSSSDTKLFLISFQGFQELVKDFKNYKLDESFGGPLEKTDGLDSDALYGISCSSSLSLLHDKVILPKSSDQDAGKSESSITNHNRPNASFGASVSFRDRGKDLLPPGSSPSRSSKRHLSQIELTKSASMDSKRGPGRDSILRSADLERVSKRRLERHTSSVDAMHDLGGKHLSRRSNSTDDLYEDDIDMLSYQRLLSKQREKSSLNSERRLQKQESHSERPKDGARSKDDKDAGKNRVKEYERSSRYQNERGWKPKTKEEQSSRDYDKHREKEKLSRDKATESSKAKALEKSASRIKSTHSICKAGFDHESGQQFNKKREREEERENSISLKRVRELESSGPLNSGKESSCGSKVKESVKSMEEEECLLTIQQGPVEKALSAETNKRINYSDSKIIKPLLGVVVDNDGSGNLSDKKPVFMDEESEKPLLTHRLFDDVLETKQEPATEATLAREMEGVSKMDMDFNLLKGMESIWDDSLGDSLSTQAEKRDQGVETSLEFLLDDTIDKETRTWLMSKQSTLYLQEEYGVDALLSTTISDVCKLESGGKTDLQSGTLQVRISMAISDTCDDAETKWFTEQAASVIKSIALRGVYVKCLWYEGPVQIHPGDGAPSVPVIVKKIKGDDGKNLERIQDETGVMIGVVLRKSGVVAMTEAEPMSRPRFIGLRLKCIRRRGLVEASKEAEALLECVAEHFSKELATHIATHIADLQESALNYSEAMSNQGSPLSLALCTKELLPHSPVKAAGAITKTSPGLFKEDDSMLASSPNKIITKVLRAAPRSSEEPEPLSAPRNERVSRPLFVSNLPEPVTSVKIRNVFESVLKEKLELAGELEGVAELVVDVKYKPDRFCAFVELANDVLLKLALKLYAEDKMVFRGMSVEEGLVAFPKTERQGSFAKGSQSKGSSSVEHAKSSVLARTTEEGHSRGTYRAGDQDSESDYSQDARHAEIGGVRADYLLDKPRPLYLTELMRNASATTIKQLFEDIITTYIGPSLVSSSGKHLILDVRYVPTRGCAFVDLATPELVEFMLDLHSQRPEVFMNMKMELGRKAVPYSVEDDGGERRVSSRSRDLAAHGSSSFGSQSLGYRLTTSASWKKLEKRSNSGAYNDYPEEFDKGDNDLLRQMSRMKKQRSDPEKTIYADRLVEGASEGIIKKIFERVLRKNLTRKELEGFGEQLITEVRHIPTKYCAFIVFANEELTRLVLQLYNKDEDAFESMRLKPHFHSRLEDLYKEDLQEGDEVLRPSSSFRERAVSNDIDEILRLREIEPHDTRSSRLAVQRAISATAFKEVDRRRSVYVDRIPEDMNETSMTQTFEKVLRLKKHGYDGHMVSQVAYFRDKFDPSKLCAFVEVKTEEGTQDLVDIYNTNQDIFMGMRIRPGFKYNS